MHHWSLVHLKEKKLSTPVRAFKNFVLHDDLFKKRARPRIQVEEKRPEEIVESF